MLLNGENILVYGTQEEGVAESNNGPYKINSTLPLFFIVKGTIKDECIQEGADKFDFDSEMAAN